MMPPIRKPGRGSADDQLAAVLANLAAPVGELADAVAERLDRLAELLALGLDVAADLPRGASRRARRRRPDRLGVAHRRSAFGVGREGVARVDARVAAPASLPPPSSTARVRFASSIACSGTGGAPACTER